MVYSTVPRKFLQTKIVRGQSPANKEVSAKAGFVAAYEEVQRPPGAGRGRSQSCQWTVRDPEPEPGPV